MRNTSTSDGKFSLRRRYVDDGKTGDYIIRKNDLVELYPNQNELFSDQILTEKEPSKSIEYSQNLDTTIINLVEHRKFDIMLKEYERELLEKYPHEIFLDRIEDFNPLEIT